MKFKLFIFSLLIFLFIIFTAFPSLKGKVSTLVFDPASGTYSTAQFVKITCATEGAKIYLITDGTDPTTLSAEYTNPSGIFILGGTLKAIAVKDGYENSDIATATYTINYGTLTNKYPWTRFLGGIDDYQVKDMVMGSDGYIYYLVGQTKNSIANYGETNKKGYDIFIAKYNYLGTPIWIKTRGVSGTDCANALALIIQGIFV